MLFRSDCDPRNRDSFHVSPPSAEYLTVRWFCAPVNRAQQTYTRPLPRSTARASLSSCWPRPTVPCSTTTVFTYVTAPVLVTWYFATASALATVLAGFPGGVRWNATNEK